MRYEIDSENWIDISISSGTYKIESCILGNIKNKTFESFQLAKDYFQEQGEYLVELNRFMQLCQYVFTN